MNRMRWILTISSVVGAALAGGCVRQGRFAFSHHKAAAAPLPSVQNASQLEPSTALVSHRTTYLTADSLSPLEIDETALRPDQLLPLRLEQCIQQALAQSRVMQDLGGALVRSPQIAPTNLDPALVYSDPRMGEEAALSAFDANFLVSNYFERNDRGLNNSFFGTNGLLQQHLNTTQVGLNKRSATGALFSLRNVSIYDRNNQQSNQFPYSWDTYLEGEMRQPLMLGFGTEFNRIAGPGAAPGQLNGILLARVRTDVSLVDFERSVRDFVADVENAYWDLYYAYRDLEARISALEIARDTLRLQAPEATSRGRRYQAEEQVLRFEAELVDALHGRPLDGTRTYNGAAPGTFRGMGGLRIAERRLRLMMGLPITDGKLLQPVDVPTEAPVVYDWNACVAEALQAREELRRQRWVIKQRELELIANRNFLLPQLDLISRYRLRGFGEDLLGPASASSSLYDGQFQEWQVGMEYAMPVGFRRAHAAVQNSRLAIAREVEVLREQERFVQFGLSNAINESRRAYENVKLQEKRLEAIVGQLNVIDLKRQDSEREELDVRLETHRRLLDARLRYHQAQVEYMLSLRNVNYEKGSLLSYCNIQLAETRAHPQAYADAAARAAARDYDHAPAHRDPIIGAPRTRAASFAWPASEPGH
jgi:hypothetical protein